MYVQKLNERGVWAANFSFFFSIFIWISFFFFYFLINFFFFFFFFFVKNGFVFFVIISGKFIVDIGRFASNAAASYLIAASLVVLKLPRNLP